MKFELAAIVLAVLTGPILLPVSPEEPVFTLCLQVTALIGSITLMVIGLTQ